MDYKFTERLKELRTEKGLSMQQLSRQLGLADYSANRWENGKTIPNAHYIFILCQFFGCSADFILGLSEE